MPQKNNIEAAFSEYSPRLLGYIQSQVGSQEDAKDILQDVFYQLARTSGDGLSEIERISSWLYKVARNAVLNFWRKKREVSLDAEDLVCEDIAQTLFCNPQDAPDTVLLRKLVWQELDIALSELPPEQWGSFINIIQKYGIDKKDVIFAATGDLDEEQRFADSIVALTKEKLIVAKYPYMEKQEYRLGGYNSWSLEQ